MHRLPLREALPLVLRTSHKISLSLRRKSRSDQQIPAAGMAVAGILAEGNCRDSQNRKHVARRLPELVRGSFLGTLQ